MIAGERLPRFMRLFRFEVYNPNHASQRENQEKAGKVFVDVLRMTFLRIASRNFQSGRCRFSIRTFTSPISSSEALNKFAEPTKAVFASTIIAFA